MAGDGTSEGLWGCSIVGAAVMHPWGAGGGASSLLGPRRRLPTRRALAAALAAAHQWDYGGGDVGAVDSGSTSLGWRWRVSYVGTSAETPREQLDNQLDYDGSKAASTTTVMALTIWMVEELTRHRRNRHCRLQ